VKSELPLVRGVMSTLKHKRRKVTRLCHFPTNSLDMSTATQSPHHNEGTSNSVCTRVAGDSSLWETPTVFLYRDYQDMVYGLDAARLVGPMSSLYQYHHLPLQTWHMIPNILIEVLGKDTASELIDAFLKQHQAEKRLRDNSASFMRCASTSSSSPAVFRKDIQVEVVKQMMFRAEKEFSLLQKVVEQLN
jgi:hypothetical protein